MHRRGRGYRVMACCACTPALNGGSRGCGRHFRAKRGRSGWALCRLVCVAIHGGTRVGWICRHGVVCSGILRRSGIRLLGNWRGRGWPSFNVMSRMSCGIDAGLSVRASSHGLRRRAWWARRCACGGYCVGALTGRGCRDIGARR